jgi:hypothetical protein
MMTLPLHTKWIGNPFGWCAPAISGAHRFTPSQIDFPFRFAIPKRYRKKQLLANFFSKDGRFHHASHQGPVELYQGKPEIKITSIDQIKFMQ